jgi:hypothetical protein
MAARQRGTPATSRALRISESTDCDVHARVGCPGQRANTASPESITMGTPYLRLRAH